MSIDLLQTVYDMQIRMRQRVKEIKKDIDLLGNVVNKLRIARVLERLIAHYVAKGGNEERVEILSQVRELTLAGDDGAVSLFAKHFSDHKDYVHSLFWKFEQELGKELSAQND